MSGLRGCSLGAGDFERLFGTTSRPAPTAPQTNAFADPFGNPRRRLSVPQRGRPLRVLLRAVTLRRPRFFPLQRNAANPAQICQSFCPASKTKIFSGGGIDNAVAPDGARYADLDNAFVYRDKLVADCTCNGKARWGSHRSTAERPDTRAGRHRGGTRRVDGVPGQAQSKPPNLRRSTARPFHGMARPSFRHSGGALRRKSRRLTNPLVKPRTAASRADRLRVPFLNQAP